MNTMDFREFTNEIVDRIPDYLLLYDIDKIELNKVLKNNGVELTGMSIRLVDEQISPNIYLDNYYSRYLAGMEMSDILLEIRQEYTSARNRIGSDMKYNIEFDNVAPNLFLKLVNYDRNAEFLKNCVHEKYMDMALTVRYLVKSDNDGIASAQVRYNDLELWGISKSDIIEIAKENTRQLFPAVYERLDVVLAGMMPGTELPELDDGGMLYVLTNAQGINGAVNMIYPDIAEEISRMNGNKDLYILPSSVHEVLFLSVDPGVSVEDLEMMVREINEYVVSEQDYLSDTVYKYDAKEKTISPAGHEQENQNDNDDFER